MAGDDTTQVGMAVLHPVQFPGGVNTYPSGQAAADHIHGSSLPARKVGPINMSPATENYKPRHAKKRG